MSLGGEDASQRDENASQGKRLLALRCEDEEEADGLYVEGALEPALCPRSLQHSEFYLCESLVRAEDLRPVEVS